ncbi:uncharacterized protein LOC143498986 [Brachyhypopomus gauderio]|uniref:uncharacterized protein LOC143498986 n=1 Tax=Brachyhypopomus gauderio TaxID=698409 RepID=UPI004042BFF2
MWQEEADLETIQHHRGTHQRHHCHQQHKTSNRSRRSHHSLKNNTISENLTKVEPGVEAQAVTQAAPIPLSAPTTAAAPTQLLTLPSTPAAPTYLLALPPTSAAPIQLTIPPSQAAPPQLLAAPSAQAADPTTAVRFQLPSPIFHFPPPPDQETLRAAAGGQADPCEDNSEDDTESDQDAEEEQSRGLTRTGAKFRNTGLIKKKKQRKERREVHQLPMVEVAGHDGIMLVHRPWTMTDIKEVMRQMDNPRDVGGERFARQVHQLCQEFKPNTGELRRLLMQHLGLDWGKVSAGWPQEDLRMTAPDWEDAENVQYRAAIERLEGHIKTAFPLRPDPGKVARCRQDDNETVEAYLDRLIVLHERYCGIENPGEMAREDGIPHVWETLLCTNFLNGLLPTLQKTVKKLCIGWETAPMTKLLSHALHAENTAKEKAKEGENKRKAKKDGAELTMVQYIPNQFMPYQGQPGRGRGRGRRRGRGGPTPGNRGWAPRPAGPGDICWTCGGAGHFAKDCPNAAGGAPGGTDQSN